MPKQDAEITLEVKAGSDTTTTVIEIDDDAKYPVIQSAVRAMVERIVGAHSENVKIEIKAQD